MFEVYLLLTLAGLGYLLQRGRSRDGPQTAPLNAGIAVPPSFSSGDRPSARTLYDSGQYWDDVVRREEARRAQACATSSGAPARTGVVPRGGPAMSAVQGPQATRAVRSELTGGVIEGFTHNNMTPFFSIRHAQNTDANALAPAFEALTGAYSLNPYGAKREVETMFAPQPQGGTATAAINQAAFQETIGFMEPPRRRHNETPFERVVVGRPGVRGGETGDVYFDSRNVSMPLSTDELRVADRPKLTFEGRTLPGLGTTSDRQELAHVDRNRPSLVAEQTQANLLRTTGAYTRELVRPEFVDKETARQTTAREHVGPALASAALREVARPAAVGAMHRVALAGPGLGPAGAAAVARAGAYTDKSSVQVFRNERDTTGTRTYQSNVMAAVKRIVAPIVDALRATGKDLLIDAPRPEGNFAPSAARRPAMTAPLGIARTTAKQTQLAEPSRANLHGPTRLTVWDSGDIARTTAKQTQVAQPARGIVSRAAALRTTVYDPNDIARATLKDVGLHDGVGGAQMAPGQRRGPALEPDSRARTTGRQTVSPVNPVRNVGAGRRDTSVRDPDAMLVQSTLRQVITDVGGRPADGALRGLATHAGGYTTADAHVPVTMRQQLADLDGTYLGGAEKGAATGGAAGAYLVTESDPRGTMRQQHADTERYGMAGGAQVREADYNAAYSARTDPTREMLLEGRDPTASSTKVSAGTGEFGQGARDTRADDVLGEGLQYDLARPSALQLPAEHELMGSGTRGRQAYSGEPTADRLDDDVEALLANPLALPPLALQ